jgi:hypothetical protein
VNCIWQEQVTRDKVIEDSNRCLTIVRHGPAFRAPILFWTSALQFPNQKKRIKFQPHPTMRTSLTTNIEHYTPLGTDALLINSRMAKIKSTFAAFGPTKRPVLPPGTVELHKIDPDGDLLLKFSRFSNVESQADEAVEPVFNVHMRVSSKHLTMVSPVFKAMLHRGNFREGRELGNTGSVDVPLPDDNPDAFLIILDVLHGYHRKVPRDISLLMLTCISILVDKYQMVEAVEVFSNGWIEHLKLPKSGDTSGLPEPDDILGLP